MTTVNCSPLTEIALGLAIRYQRSVYDSIYVALALDRKCPFVTADRRLRNSLQRELPNVVFDLGDLDRLTP
jgi:predicted nucleic acid-binding protein